MWGVHIGADRALGYGLKYPTGFGDTHLGAKGERDAPAIQVAEASRPR